jgi:hypothetical protein
MVVCCKLPGGASISHDIPNECFVEGQFNVNADCTENSVVLLAPTAQETSHVVLILACRLTAAEMCLPLRWVATFSTRTLYKTVSLLRFVYGAVA